jgi:hypothetical protein
MTTMSEALRQIMTRHHVPEPAASAVIDSVLAREDSIADILRLAGTQFGLYPEIVAKVLMDAGLGTPPTDEVRAMLNRQFADRLAWMREQFNNPPTD